MTYFIFSLILVAIYIVYNYLAEKPQKRSSWVWVVGVGMVIGGLFYGINYAVMPTLAYDHWPVYAELFLFDVLGIVTTSIRTSDGESILDVDNWLIRRTLKEIFFVIRLMICIGIVRWIFG